ncbi:MAG: winged helix-turn-helix domain-containing protein [Candidatus Aenigmarchaeota archaeon]|nr:winged helix-turn-helix domain-containing protein [Candidatus Aenigmarchaeota archaeon]
MTKIKTEKLFGTNAGKIWKALNKKGEKTAAALEKETKLKITEVHSSLGWLAREGKISADKTKTGTIFSLL